MKTREIRNVMENKLGMSLYSLFGFYQAQNNLLRLKALYNGQCCSTVMAVGTIIRSSMLKVLEYERVYICSKCKQVMSVAADFNQYYTITKPSKCSKDGCKSNSFTATNDAGLNKINKL